MEALISIIPLEWGGIGSALLAGGIIGLERQMMGKAVGIRTSALICLATYLFIAMSFSVANNVTDPSRIIGQVVTGVGFLGAGVIIARDGVVLGVTSAAVIWVLAAIGVIVGVGNHILGIFLALLAVAVLVGLDYLESGFKSLQKSVDEAFVHRHKRGNKEDVSHEKDKAANETKVTSITKSKNVDD